MVKKLYMGTNLKMYKTARETVEYLEKLQGYTSDFSDDELYLFVIPSFTSLESAVKSVDQSRIKLGAQNMHWEDQGQFTGEVSPLMLKEIGVDIVEIGHSERRHVFSETDVQENLKVLSGFKHGFTPLLCVGETAEQKDKGISAEALRIQLKIGLHGVSESDVEKLILAYEPVWAIGVNGTPAGADYVELMHREIKKTLKFLFPERWDRIPVMYGGSVNPGNACEMIKMESVDGLFVGRAAWDADNFNILIRQVYSAWERKIRQEEYTK